MHKLVLTLLGVFAVSVSLRLPHDPQQIDSSDTGAMIKASFMYQFANNNDWPAENKKGKFIVGVYGNSSLYDEMASRYGSKPAGSQVIEVLELVDVPANQFLHILYVDRSRKSELPRVLKLLKDKHTLVVTDFDGALVQGAAINFKTVDSNIRYELNEQVAKEKQINLGVKILQWAVK